MTRNRPSIKRARAGLVLTALLLPLLLPIQNAPASGAAVITKRFTAVADTYVNRAQPRRNFGTSPRLRVDAGPRVVSYVRFNVKGFKGKPQRVMLRVFQSAGQGEPSRLHPVLRTKWGERLVRWGNRPRIGKVIASTGPTRSGRWVVFNVTRYVDGNGPVAFALTTRSSASRVFHSREGTRKPKLVVTGRRAPTSGPSPVVIAAAGDIACKPDDPGFNNGEGTADRCRMKATSDLVLDMNPKQVWALGDLQYNKGELENFMASYDPTWGRFKAKTKPVIGNHEYGTAGAAGYFEYFGDAATPREPGCRSSCEAYYSFDVGAWHAVVLNGECAELDAGEGCAQGSPQQRWLARDLAAHPNRCTVAVVHKPLWSSNTLKEDKLAPLVRTMYDAGVDLMLAGHSHAYERFAPQDPDGRLDDARGIRQIVVGTGGSFFSGFPGVEPNSEKQGKNIFGVLKLTLKTGGYDWEFVADPTTPFTDTGSDTCH